jgi:methyltransferase family protein
MFRFWNRFIHPLVSTLKPGRILEIGADSGWNTRHILEYCRANGCVADIVDPAPRPRLQEVFAEFEHEYRYYPLKSVHAIPQIESPDVVLLDGDHNWATVYTELKLLYAHAERAGKAPPVILLHDAGWPYARRDMYYSPEDLHESERHPYAYRGVMPGESALTELGMNGMLANALHEGGPCNGVLTAVEDFVASVPDAISVYTLPFFNGLGIVVPEARMTDPLKSLIESFFSAESLLKTCCELEEYFMKMNASLQQTEASLTRRTDALVRARGLLHEQQQRIVELERALATTIPTRT